MATRLLGAQPTAPKRPLAPERKEDWNQLLRSAIERATATGDRRLEGLRKALVDGRAEAFLRLQGIIHERDLAREFPTPKNS